MIPLINNPNVDQSDPINYPGGRIKDNDGSGNGTGVNRNVYGDIHANISKLLRRYSINPNNVPDNETNGYQIIQALMALPSKNDIVAGISTSGGVLVAEMKIGFLEIGEKMYCKSACNFTTETTIKGTDNNTTYALTVVGDFVINDYVELIRTTSGVELRRVVDQTNINSVVTALNFLKAATVLEDIDGIITNKACTPASSLAAFVYRVIGDDSGDYLATTLRNGLYPKEHYSAVLELAKIRNVGTFSGLNIGDPTIGHLFPVTGNITQAKITQGTSNFSEIEITFANTMDDLAYRVEFNIESLSTSEADSQTAYPVFKPISPTKFLLSIREIASEVQQLKFHIKVIKL